MADLTELQASQSVKIAGSGPSSGIEDNWMDVDSLGNAHVVATSSGPVTPGTAATNSDLAGGQFNTVPPTLTTGQQAALQIDAAGNLLTNGGIVSNTGTLISRSVTIVSSVVLAANPARKGFSLVNLGAAPVFIAFAATCSSVLYTINLGGGVTLLRYEMFSATYKGVVSAVSSSGTNIVVATELT